MQRWKQLKEPLIFLWGAFNVKSWRRGNLWRWQKHLETWINTISMFFVQLQLLGIVWNGNRYILGCWFLLILVAASDRQRQFSFFFFKVTKCHHSIQLEMWNSRLCSLRQARNSTIEKRWMRRNQATTLIRFLLDNKKIINTRRCAMLPSQALLPYSDQKKSHCFSLFLASYPPDTCLLWTIQMVFGKPQAAWTCAGLNLRIWNHDAVVLAPSRSLTRSSCVVLGEFGPLHHGRKKRGESGEKGRRWWLVSHTYLMQ